MSEPPNEFHQSILPNQENFKNLKISNNGLLEGSEQNPKGQEAQQSLNGGGEVLKLSQQLAIQFLESGNRGIGSGMLPQGYGPSQFHVGDSQNFQYQQIFAQHQQQMKQTDGEILVNISNQITLPGYPHHANPAKYSVTPANTCSAEVQSHNSLFTNPNTSSHQSVTSHSHPQPKSSNEQLPNNRFQNENKEKSGQLPKIMCNQLQFSLEDSSLSPQHLQASLNRSQNQQTVPQNINSFDSGFVNDKTGMNSNIEEQKVRQSAGDSSQEKNDDGKLKEEKRNNRGKYVEIERIRSKEKIQEEILNSIKKIWADTVFDGESLSQHSSLMSSSAKTPQNTIQNQKILQNIESSLAEVVKDEQTFPDANEQQEIGRQYQQNVEIDTPLSLTSMLGPVIDQGEQYNVAFSLSEELGYGPSTQVGHLFMIHQKKQRKQRITTLEQNLQSKLSESLQNITASECNDAISQLLFNSLQGIPLQEECDGETEKLTGNSESQKQINQNTIRTSSLNDKAASASSPAQSGIYEP